MPKIPFAGSRPANMGELRSRVGSRLKGGLAPLNALKVYAQLPAELEILTDEPGTLSGPLSDLDIDDFDGETINEFRSLHEEGWVDDANTPRDPYAAIMRGIGFVEGATGQNFDDGDVARDFAINAYWTHATRLALNVAARADEH
jgi:hypothetical protein